MLHRFLLVSSENGSQPVTEAQPEVSILPPGDGDWTVIAADKVEELGHGWYRAELGDWSGDERLIVNASAQGALDWRDIIDLDRASLTAAAATAENAATTAKDAATAAVEAANAAKDAQEAAGIAQTSAAESLQTATTTANETLALLRELQTGGDPALEIVRKNPAAWSFHDPADTFTHNIVNDGVELTCKRATTRPVQLYDFGYALAAGQYQLEIEVEGTDGASFRFEVLQHDRPYYGLGKSSNMTVGGSGKQVLNLKNDNSARLRLWFSELAKPGDKYLIKSISLKQI